MTFWLPAVWSHCFPIFLPGVLFIYVGTESVSLIQHCYFGICSRRAYLHPQPRLGTSSDVLPWHVCSHPDFKRRQSEATLMFTSESVMRYLDSCFWPTVWRHAGVTKQLTLRFCFTIRQSQTARTAAVHQFNHNFPYYLEKKSLCHLSNFVFFYFEFWSFQIKILWIWQILISGYRFKLQQTLFVMSGMYSITMCDRKAPLVLTLRSTPTSLVWALWWSPISFGDSVYEVLFEIR